MDLNEVVVFIKVVQAGSFSLAAKQLEMPNSTVSAKVSSLEKRLGTTLITRTTRRLSVTPAGEAYFKKCLHGLEEIQAGEDAIAAAKGEPQGLLRITAPIDLGVSILASVVNAYTLRYPKVTVELMLSDRKVDLLAEGVDLAIRAGELKDSTLVAKKLGDSHFVTLAAPKYLKVHGYPQNPRDLREHQCLHFAPLGHDSWKLIGPKGALTVQVPGRVIANELGTLKALAVAGAGIALIPSFYCRGEEAAGRLERVLPDWQTASNPVHFVYPAQKFVTPKLTAFIEMATEPIRKSLKDV